MGMIEEMAIMRIMEVMQIMATGIRAIIPKGGAKTGYMCVERFILNLTWTPACVLRVLLTNPTFRFVCPRATGFISRWGKLNFDICEVNCQIKAGFQNGVRPTEHTIEHIMVFDLPNYMFNSQSPVVENRIEFYLFFRQYTTFRLLIFNQDMPVTRERPIADSPIANEAHVLVAVCEDTTYHSHGSNFGG